MNAVRGGLRSHYISLMRDRCVVNTSGIARRVEVRHVPTRVGLGHAVPFSAPELALSNRLSFEACGLPDTAGGGGAHPDSSRCHLSRRPPAYPPRLAQPRR